MNIHIYIHIPYKYKKIMKHFHDITLHHYVVCGGGLTCRTKGTCPPTPGGPPWRRGCERAGGRPWCAPLRGGRPWGPGGPVSVPAPPLASPRWTWRWWRWSEVVVDISLSTGNTITTAGLTVHTGPADGHNLSLFISDVVGQYWTFL